MTKLFSEISVNEAWNKILGSQCRRNKCSVLGCSYPSPGDVLLCHNASKKKTNKTKTRCIPLTLNQKLLNSKVNSIRKSRICLEWRSVLLLQERLLLCGPDWPQIHNPPAPISWVLELQAHATTSNRGSVLASSISQSHSFNPSKKVATSKKTHKRPSSSTSQPSDLWEYNLIFFINCAILSFFSLQQKMD